MPMHSSCIIMEELIYGVMDRANTVARENALPDMALYRPSTVSLRVVRKYSLRAATST